MTAYYNENDPYVAQWLRNLVAAGHLPAGHVDDRSILEVEPGDLDGYDECHFFAGIGGWPLALQLAGWPADRPVWTGSCPCQALSGAARGRTPAPDLWPAWAGLIAARRPRTLFGEQVAQKGAWLDRVCDDLDSLGYEVGAAVLPAVSVGADHARPRIYFVGHTDREGEPSLRLHAEVAGLQRHRRNAGNLATPDGVPARVGRLRAYGNAVVPQVAAGFIRSFIEPPGGAP